MINVQLITQSTFMQPAHLGHEAAQGHFNMWPGETFTCSEMLSLSVIMVGPQTRCLWKHQAAQVIDSGYKMFTHPGETASLSDVRSVLLGRTYGPKPLVSSSSIITHFPKFSYFNHRHVLQSVLSRYSCNSCSSLLSSPCDHISCFWGRCSSTELLLVSFLDR